MIDQLVKTHEKFNAAYVLLDTEDPVNLQNFLSTATTKLLSAYPAELNKIIQRIGYFSNEFDKDKIYRTVSFDKIDNDEFVNTLIKDVFATWGCLSQESGKIDALVDDGLVTSDYRIKADCRIIENVVKGQDAEWKVFAYNGDSISAVLVCDEIYGATCLSLAADAMDGINDNLNISCNLDVDTDGAHEKHLKLDEGFVTCLKADVNGKVVRFLRAGEHENNYLQLKEALEKVPLTDAADDGYFFVQDNQGKLLFADRGSEDVYRHIHVDAYASIIPVIDIDYNKYKAYLQSKNS